MTRWKREATSTLRLMHDHHEYSQWHYHVLDAAAEHSCVGGVAGAAAAATRCRPALRIILGGKKQK